MAFLEMSALFKEELDMVEVDGEITYAEVRLLISVEGMAAKDAVELIIRKLATEQGVAGLIHNEGAEQVTLEDIHVKSIPRSRARWIVEMRELHDIDIRLKEPGGLSMEIVAALKQRRDTILGASDGHEVITVRMGVPAVTQDGEPIYCRILGFRVIPSICDSCPTCEEDCPGKAIAISGMADQGTESNEGSKEAIGKCTAAPTAEELDPLITVEKILAQIAEGWATSNRIAQNIIGDDTWGILEPWDRRILTAKTHKKIMDGRLAKAFTITEVSLSR